jgi:hypothetical protein
MGPQEMTGVKVLKFQVGFFHSVGSVIPAHGYL